MKMIESNGGPLIGLHQSDIFLWNGIDGRNFFDMSDDSMSDYEKICDITKEERYHTSGCVITSKGSAFFLSLPFPALIVEANADHIYIAQIEAAEEDWSETILCASDFEQQHDWKDPSHVFLKGGDLVLFDSACVESDFRDDVIVIGVHEGSYRCEWARHEWPDQADVILVRIVRDNLQVSAQDGSKSG